MLLIKSTFHINDTPILVRVVDNTVIDITAIPADQMTATHFEKFEIAHCDVPHGIKHRYRSSNDAYDSTACDDSSFPRRNGFPHVGTVQRK